MFPTHHITNKKKRKTFDKKKSFFALCVKRQPKGNLAAQLSFILFTMKTSLEHCWGTKAKVMSYKGKKNQRKEKKRERHEQNTADTQQLDSNYMIITQTI